MTWVMKQDKDISWEHCGRPAYWENEEVYCSKCQAMLEQRAGLYVVTFVGDYFNLTTTVLDAENEEQAIKLAILNIQDYYSWDLEAVSQEITATLEATYN